MIYEDKILQDIQQLLQKIIPINDLIQMFSSNVYFFHVKYFN